MRHIYNILLSKAPMIMGMALFTLGCSSSLPLPQTLDPLSENLIVLSTPPATTTEEEVPQNTPSQEVESAPANTTSSQPEARPAAGAIERNDPSRAPLIEPTPVNPSEQELSGCPAIDVPRDAEIYQIFANGNLGDQRSLIYQAALNDTSSQCIGLPDGSTRLSVGLAGRLVLGPQGQSPTKIKFPLAVVVRKLEGTPIFDKVYMVHLNLAQGQSTIRFAEKFDNIILRPKNGKKLDVNNIRLESGFPPPPQ